MIVIDEPNKGLDPVPDRIFTERLAAPKITKIRCQKTKVNWKKMKILTDLLLSVGVWAAVAALVYASTLYYFSI